MFMVVGATETDKEDPLVFGHQALYLLPLFLLVGAVMHQLILLMRQCKLLGTNFENLF